MVHYESTMYMYSTVLTVPQNSYIVHIVNTQEITMPLLFNQWYESVCFVFMPRPLTWTLLANKVLAQSMDVLSVFIDRIS